MNIITETELQEIPTTIEDCPPLNVFGLSDLIRNQRGPQAHNTFFAENGSTCAIAGALLEIVDMQDM